MDDNPLFYDKSLLNPTSYREWLIDSGVSWVALPDIEPRLLGTGRGQADRSRPASYLKLVWHNEHWRLWKVIGSSGMATGPSRLVSLRPDQIVIDAAKAGRTVIRVRYTPAWNIISGRACVGPASGPWTEVISRGPGRIVIGTTLLGRDTHCPERLEELSRSLTRNACRAERSRSRTSRPESCSRGAVGRVSARGADRSSALRRSASARWGTAP